MNPLQAAALGTIHREKRTIALFCAVCWVAGITALICGLYFNLEKKISSTKCFKKPFQNRKRLVL